MAVLIFAGVAALAIGLMLKPGKSDGPAAIAMNKARLLRLGLPEGTSVKTAKVESGRLILHVGIPGKGPWIYVIPLDGGAPLKIAVTGSRKATPSK